MKGKKRRKKEEKKKQTQESNDSGLDCIYFIDFCLLSKWYIEILLDGFLVYCTCFSDQKVPSQSSRPLLAKVLACVACGLARSNEPQHGI
jgi:hypothetical protein